MILWFATLLLHYRKRRLERRIRASRDGGFDGYEHRASREIDRIVAAIEALT